MQSNGGQLGVRFWEKSWFTVISSLAVLAFVSSVSYLAIGWQPAVLALFALLYSSLWLILSTTRKAKLQLEQIKQSYKQERDRFIALINTLDSAVITTDSQGLITLYNHAALLLLNTHDSLSGQQLGKLFPFQDASQQPVDVVKLSADARRAIARDDIDLRLNQNELLHLQVIAAPIAQHFGKSGGGFVVTIRDITKQKSLDEERNDFVSVTSHELRTPIAVIEAGLASLEAPAIQNGMTPEAKKLIKTSHDKIKHLGQLVKDLSTLAKAQGQFLDIDIVSIDPQQLVTQLKVAHEKEASDKGINLILHPMLQLHPVLTSPNYVHEILENYVTNALKYTKSGGVVSIGAENTGENSVRFWVEDNGIGINTTDQKKLFTKFFRAEDFHTRQTEGTGLGLYITKKLAERINAKVWCISEIGKGSIFFLEVPPVGGLRTDANKVTAAEIEDFASAI